MKLSLCLLLMPLLRGGSLMVARRLLSGVSLVTFTASVDRAMGREEDCDLRELLETAAAGAVLPPPGKVPFCNGSLGAVLSTLFLGCDISET